MPDCSAPSPETGHLCTMAKGHFGAHKVGGPYTTVEEFVIQCTDKPCNYHTNSRLIGRQREDYEQCIHCGHDDTFGIFHAE